MRTLESTTPAPDRFLSAHKAGFLDRLFSSLFVRELECLCEGSVTVTFPDGSIRRFGSAGSPLETQIRINEWRAFGRLILGGDLGAAEAYADGDWEATDLVKLVRIFIANSGRFDRDTPLVAVRNLWERVRHATRRNTRHGSKKNIVAHYDLGNEMYQLFLDESMVYSCALFEENGESLERAQQRKLMRVAELARLSPGLHVLEIGCGWGAFAILAAKLFGCRVTGLTLSREQAEWARRRVKEEGVEDLVTIELKDYRALAGSGCLFDRVVSIEMLEAVGYEYLGTYFRSVDAFLGSGGVAVIQFISIPDARHERLLRRPDFIKRHIFPGSHIPSVGAVAAAIARSSRLSIESLDSIGPHYAETLRRWRVRFLENRGQIARLGYPESFLRMWEYYLAYCEGGFASRFVNDFQMVLSRAGNQSLGPIPAYQG